MDILNTVGIEDEDSMDSSISVLDTQLIVHDPIHGSFALPRLAWVIIDTPEFQRLRHIKQTGNTCYVYPGAEHTRFQHCLGVAHLALVFGRAIKIKYPDMITDHQILLLCIAGLCHDLGHCAFSHLYDAYIIPMFQEQLKEAERELTQELAEANQELAEANQELAEAEQRGLVELKDTELMKATQVLKEASQGLAEAAQQLAEAPQTPQASQAPIITHEEASYLILSRIWEHNQEVRDSLTKTDLRTIGKMILGAPTKVPERLKTELQWTDQDYKHEYLYEVVSNYRTGIDVDKFDYLKRDSHYTGIPCTFDPQRLMTFLSLKRTRSGNYIVDYLRKSDELINAMWLSRDDLHRRAYQHRVVKCIDLMITEMIRLCADAPVPGTNPPVLLRNAHHKLDSYLLLTDATLVAIAEHVPKAKAILDRIRRRDLWKTVATVISAEPLNIEFSETKADVRISHASFRDEHVYYIYHIGQYQIDAMFFVELISQAKGGEIHLRIRDQARWLQELRK